MSARTWLSMIRLRFRGGLAALLLLCSACHGTPSSGSRPPARAKRGPILPVSGQFDVIQGAFGTSPASLALGDCNGDGLLDVANVQGMQGPAIMTREPDGSLSQPMTIPNATQYLTADAATFVDLDGDGKTDLLMGDQQVLFLKGHGDCTFDAPVPLSPKYPENIKQIHVTDVDLDGLADIVATRLSQPMATSTEAFSLLIARGDGHYDDRTPAATPLMQVKSYTPFGTFWDDFDGDGTRDLVASVDTGESWMSWGVPGDLPSFQRDNAVSQAVANGDSMGVTALDFNRDGTMDYFVAHGSALPLLMSFDGRRMTNHGYEAYLDATDVVGGTLAWGTYAFDADMDGWMDMLVLNTTIPRTPAPAQFFHNNHDGTFVELHTQVLGGLSSDAFRLACGDVMANGQVVCYAQSWTVPAVVIENHLVQKGNWVGIRLRGTVSSPEAEGARISLTGAQPPELLYYGAQCPTDNQHDRAVLLPIGGASSADVDVTWPSGLHQHVSGLASDTYTTIVEPQVLTVSRRVVPADGQQTVTIQVDPSQNGGDGSVTIDKTGDGSWMSYTQAQGTTWTRTLQAPAMPGSARIQVTIGGQALLVRPRITFVAQ